MIPWKQQQFWFWLAAILVVVSASALRDTTPQTVESNQDSEKPQSTREVIRLRSDLPPDLMPTPLPEIRPVVQKAAVQKVAFEEQAEPEVHLALENGYQELITAPVEIIQAEFLEQAVRDENEPAQIVQLSLEQIDSAPVEQPAVWLRGTIEAADDVPQIRPRQ